MYTWRAWGSHADERSSQLGACRTEELSHDSYYKWQTDRLPFLHMFRVLIVVTLVVAGVWLRGFGRLVEILRWGNSKNRFRKGSRRFHMSCLSRLLFARWGVQL